MTHEQLVRQLAQLQAQAQMLGESIRTLIDLVDAPKTEPKPQSEPEPPEEDEEGNCLHPEDFRTPAAAMGINRNRYYCGRCQGYGGVLTGEKK